MPGRIKPVAFNYSQWIMSMVIIVVLGLYIVYFLLLIHSVNVGEVEPDDPDF